MASPLALSRVIINAVWRIIGLFIALVALSACPQPAQPSAPPPLSEAVGGGGGNGAPKWPFCGTGHREGTEACDGYDFIDGATCTTLGLGGGTLRCNDDCTIDTSGCDKPDYCSANDLYGNNECDPCHRLGGVPDPECTRLCSLDDVCSDRYEPLVGDFVCRIAGLGDADCNDCGDGVVHPGELCDGADFTSGFETCEAWGFEPHGWPSCTFECLPNFRGCYPKLCGNQMMEPPEQCDDTVDATCVEEGFPGGTLRCGGDCRFDYATCIHPDCGNGLIDFGEDCDGDMLGNATCASEGFTVGALGCTSNCAYELRSCRGRRRADLHCELDILMGEETCETQGYAGGTLKCGGELDDEFDTSECIPWRTCGNGVVDAPEHCDGPVFATSAQADCIFYGFTSGTVGCAANCVADTSACN